MKKIKFVPICLKWRENWLKIISGFFDLPRPSGDGKNVDKKNKVVPNWLKLMRDNFRIFLPTKMWTKKSNLFQLVGNNFWHHPPTPIWDKENLDTKFKLVPNWMKWLETWSEITLTFLGTPLRPSHNRELKKLVKWKNQSHSKLEEMTQKMVRNYFWFLANPTPSPHTGSWSVLKWHLTLSVFELEKLYLHQNGLEFHQK